MGASCSGGACELVEDEGGAFGDESARVVDIRALRAGPTRLTVHARSAENEDWYGSADVTFIDPSRVVLAPDPYSVWREGLGVVTGATIQWMTVESFLGDDLSPLTCSDREGIRAAMQPPLLTATRYPGKALDLRADAPGVSVVDVAIGSASQHLEVRVVSPEEIVGGSLHRLRRAEFPRTIPVAIDSATVDTLKLGVLGEAYLVPVWAARDGVSAVGGAGNFVSDSPHVVLDVPKSAAGSSASSNSVFIVHAVSVGRATLRGRLGQTSVELTIDVVDAPP